MSQHDLTIDNQGFPAFRADLNNALQALGSTQSGTSAPSPTFANQLWYDTTNNQLKIRNEDNDAWITLLTLDQSGDVVSQLAATIAVLSAGSASAPALTTSGDTNTGIFFPAADTIAFAEGGAEAMRINSSGNIGIGNNNPAFGLVVEKDNGNGYSASFRRNNTDALLTIRSENSVTGLQGVSSDGNSFTNVLLNASGGNVGIGNNNPSQKLHIASSSGTYVQVQNTGNSINAYYGVDTGGGWMGTSTNHYAAFYTNNTERMRITSGGDLQFNSGYGSVATAYGCRAWVNFNGTGTVAIRASGNVTSITDNGTGDYTVNFTNAMPDANYVIAGTSGLDSTDANIRRNTGSTLTGSVRINTMTYLASNVDRDVVNIMVFR